MRVITIGYMLSTDVLASLDTAPAEAKKELKQIINETAMTMRQEIYGGSRTRYTLKPGKFRKGDIHIKRATASMLRATLTTQGDMIPLREGYRTRKNGKRKGAQAEVLKGSGMKQIRGSQNIKAFVAGVGWKSKSGESGTHYGVWQRNTKSEDYNGRFPIKEVYGPNKASIVNELYDELEEETASGLARRVQALAERVMP